MKLFFPLSIILIIIFSSYINSENSDSTQSLLLDIPEIKIPDYAKPNEENKNIKSIKVYQMLNDNDIPSHDFLIDGRDTLYFEAYINYDKKGLILQYNEVYDDNTNLRKTQYFYNKNNQLVAEIMNGNWFNYYFYNTKNDLENSVSFYSGKDGFRNLTKKEINYQPDSINIVEKQYWSDTLLTCIFYKKLISKNNTFIKSSYRVLMEDTAYNHFPEIDTFSFINNKPFLTSHKDQDYTFNYTYTFFPDGKIKSQKSKNSEVIWNQFGDILFKASQYDTVKYNYTYDERKNWILRVCTKNRQTEKVKRVIEYYKNYDPEIKGDFKISDSLVSLAKSQIFNIPAYADSKQKRLDKRKKDFNEGNFGKIITLLKGKNIDEFLPKYWKLVSTDTGKLQPWDSTIIVAAFNTPVRSKVDTTESARCLAIFEKRGNILFLKEQFFDVLLPFSDGSVEAKEYSIQITENSLETFYQYMRGEVSYCYEFDKKSQTFKIIRAESVFRSYTRATIQSYDYKKNLLHYADLSFSGDLDPGEPREIDTTLIVKKHQRPANIPEEEWISPDTIFAKGYGTIYY